MPRPAALLNTLSAGPSGGRTGLALDGSGNLYVNNFNTGGLATAAQGAVLKYTGPNFTSSTTIISGKGADFSPPTLAGLQGLVFDGSSLFAASLLGQQVIKLDTSGNVLGVLAQSSSADCISFGIAARQRRQFAGHDFRKQQPRGPDLSDAVSRQHSTVFDRRCVFGHVGV